eukprot:TRINITY_DN1074_c0_g1_i3.p1 TRINITY_DN1074_c0_g1~~TRINITY_DN1074_c0_g1_i3.p1  ORF type:complete len:597 (+),score=144.14 TRINITY_DN1074_c0_g1_i3:93-1883(+)
MGSSSSKSVKKVVPSGDSRKKDPSPPDPLPISAGVASSSSSISRVEQVISQLKLKNLTQSQLDKFALCVQHNDKFTDPDFPPTSKSLFFEEHRPPASWPPIARNWSRVTALSKNARMLVNGVEPGDVIQGVLGDCWLLGALSTVATDQQLLENLILTPIINDWGIYQFQFYKNGEWVTVTIDDYIPVAERTGKPVFSSSLDPDEMWVMLLEKAYAKLHGCYENLEGGSETYALVDLTGGVTETINVNASTDLNKAWTQLKVGCKNHLLGCANVDENMGTESNTGMGILANHAYGILGTMKAPDGTRLLRIRNPWGDSEWMGAWRDTDPKWDEIKKKYPEFIESSKYVANENDGTFYISLEDFVKQYNRVYILEMFQDSEYQYAMDSKLSQWKGTTAGGAPSGDNPWRNNVQFFFDLMGTSDVNICLMQEDIKMRGIRDLEHEISIGFLVLKGSDPDTPIPKVVKSALVDKTVYINSREVSLTLRQLPPGKYVILPTTFKPGEEAAYSLRIATRSQPVVIKLIPIAPSGHQIPKGADGMSIVSVVPAGRSENVKSGRPTSVSQSWVQGGYEKTEEGQAFIFSVILFLILGSISYTPG